MDVIISELEGSWLRFILSIPLDVLVFVTLFYGSAGLSFSLFKTRRRAAAILSVTVSGVVFGCYYLLLRTRLLDFTLLTLALEVALVVCLLLAPAIMARDRSRALKFVKLLAVAATRRILEFAFAIVVLVALFPFMLLIAVLIKVTTGGSVLVKQPSSSHSGRAIMLYSFRTRIPYKYSYFTNVFFMSSEKDWRLTSFGRFLHKSSLHLLPRLLNVLNGDLHLIGLTPLSTKLMLSSFSQDLLKREYDLVENLYDVKESKTFTKIFDYCIPTGVVTYTDLNAYKLHPLRRTVVKLLDMRPRLREEADYFLAGPFPSLRLFIVLLGTIVIRFLTAVNLLRLEEIRETRRVIANEET